MLWAVAVSAPLRSPSRVTLCHNTAGATRDQSAVWPAECGIYLSVHLAPDLGNCQVLCVEEGTNKYTDKLFLYPPPVLAACP